MHTYAKKLKSLLEKHANPAEAAPMKKYMRDQFEYLGIKTPQRAALLKDFQAEYGLPGVNDLDSILRGLWSLPEREFQYVAVGLLDRMSRQLSSDFTSTIEYLLTTKSWWDTVDSIAGGTVGTHFRRYPAVRKKYLARWRTSENFWLRRTTILFQLNYKEDTDFELLCNIIRQNLGSDEFFINKAIGWALRQYARTDPKAVKKFVLATKGLHPLSRREAIKHL